MLIYICYKDFGMWLYASSFCLYVCVWVPIWSRLYLDQIGTHTPSKLRPWTPWR